MTKNENGGNGLGSRAQARHQAILAAATQLFLEKGYERTSLSDVVALAKGSRSTLYDLFGNKEGLLRAMVKDSCSQVWQTVEALTETSTAGEQELVELGTQFALAVLSPNAVAVYRIMIAEARHIPDMASFFFDLGPGIVKERISRWIQASRPEAKLDYEHADTMTSIFLGSLLGDFQHRVLIGLVESYPVEEVRARVQIAVKIFLDGIGRG
jgi:AcrR family transcriptional regulator